LQANEHYTKRNKLLSTVKENKMLKPKKRELTKNGHSVSARLTESEYREWVALGKGKWLRAFLKDSRFERKANASV